MYTDHSPALGAFPPFLLFFNKSPDAQLLNIGQVFYHAHPVFGPISLVQVLNPIAGVFRAGKTKPWLVLPEIRTFLDDTGNAARRFVLITPNTHRTLGPLPHEIYHSNPAVHATGGD